ncbi:hypothetical protein BH10PSE7_BH10PSE7_44290 [soil metagenome]
MVGGIRRLRPVRWCACAGSLGLELVELLAKPRFTVPGANALVAKKGIKDVRSHGIRSAALYKGLDVRS